MYTRSRIWKHFKLFIKNSSKRKPEDGIGNKAETRRCHDF